MKYKYFSTILFCTYKHLSAMMLCAIIFCSSLTVQSAENLDFDFLKTDETPVPELNEKDRASTINAGDTVVFDYSQAVFVNGNLKFPVSIFTDDSDVFAVDFQFRFNNVDFTFDTVLNTYNLTALNGIFNTTDQKLRVSSFDNNVLPNNTNLITLSFNTTSTEFCALNPYDIFVLLNGVPCSYKIVGCVNEPPNAGLDQNICADSTILTANSIFTGTAFWSVISGSGTFANPNQPATLVSGLSAGANVFRWTFPANSNTPETFDEVTIFRNLSPSIADAGANLEICLNSQAINLTGTPLGGFWSGHPLVTTAGVFTPSSVGTYTLTYSVGAGSCLVSDEINIQVIALPSVAFTLEDTLFCNSDAAITLTSGTPAGGVYFGSGVNGNQFDPSLTLIGESTIGYSYTDLNGCSNFVNENIVVEICTFLANSDKKKSFHVYPNPSSGVLNIQFTEFDSSKKYTLKVTNALGQLVYNSSINQQTTIIELQFFAKPGMYYVHLFNEQNNVMETKKLIVQ
jgi:hypothetical protein